jgi:oxygen-independent coproporphyrinogen-3 oxidase
MFKELPNEDTQLEHLLHLDQWMRAAGFEHYEISNFARPGKRARHNLAYWKGESYLGLGPSAHSYDAGLRHRWKNVSSLHKYGQLLAQGQSPLEWTEELTDQQTRLESWMLALRLEEGFSRDWLKAPWQAARAATLTEQGLLEPHPNENSRLRLTPRGFALSDQVIAALAQ